MKNWALSGLERVNAKENCKNAIIVHFWGQLTGYTIFKLGRVSSIVNDFEFAV